MQPLDHRMSLKRCRLLEVKENGNSLKMHTLMQSIAF